MIRSIKILILLSFLSVFLFASSKWSFAGSSYDFYKIAVEWQKDGQFANVIGSAEVTFLNITPTIKIVTYGDLLEDGRLTVFTHYFETLEYDEMAEGIYRVQVKNELDQVYSGILNVTSNTLPQFTLRRLEGREFIVNLSDKGKEFKDRLLPSLDLGE